MIYLTLYVALAVIICGALFAVDLSRPSPYTAPAARDETETRPDPPLKWNA